MGANGCTGHGEDRVDACGPHECAFAGHVGATDEEKPVLGVEGEVVADAAGIGNQGMAQAGGNKGGISGEDLREGIVGMLEAVGGEGEKGFHLGDCGEPLRDDRVELMTPGVCYEGELNGVKEGNIEEPHQRIFERLDVLDDGVEPGDRVGGGDSMGRETVLQGLERGGLEGLLLDSREQAGEKLEVSEGVLGLVENRLDSGTMDRDDDAFEKENEKERSALAGGSPEDRCRDH